MGSEFIAQMQHIEPPHAFQSVICIRLYHHSSVTQSSMAITGYSWFMLVYSSDELSKVRAFSL